MNENISGLQNIGNTCYFNSLIQALKCLKTFNSEIEKHSDTSELCRAIHNCKKTKFDVSDIYSELKNINQNINFNIGTPEDSTEVYIKLLEVLPEPIKDLFKVRYSHFTFCLKCEDKIVTDSATVNQPELIIFQYGDMQIKTNATKLNDFTCEKCKSKDVCLVKVLVRVSKIICIVFSKYIRKELWDYPDKMTIKRTDGDKTYRLKSYIEHLGGHYVTEGEIGNKYYNFNDSYVSSIPNLSVKKNTYAVFYELED